MFDVSVSSNDDEITQATPKGVRVSSSNTPAKILSQLPDSGRGWYILKPNDYPTELRSNSYLKIFNKKGRSETRGSRGDRDYIYVFEKLCRIDNNSGGGGGGIEDKGKSNSLDICAMCGTSSGSQLNTDPAVFITSPKINSIVIRGSTGVDADGTAYDSKSVALSWGAGNESKDVSNDSWDTILPLGVGDHELTATVDGDTKSVQFSVVLKPAITGYTAEQIQALKTYTNNAKIREVEQVANTLAREAGLKETTDDYTGFALCRKVNDFATKASGDFSLFYSGSGDKAFIEKKIDRIFGTHLTANKKTALITKLEAMKTAGFVDATDEFHDAMKNTFGIFFAENSVGKIISDIDIPLAVNPVMVLVMDSAKTAVNIKLNIQLGLESNGAPLLMRQEAKQNAFDAVAIEVAGAAVGGVVVKAGSKTFKVIKSYFRKFEHIFSKKPKTFIDPKSASKLNDPARKPKIENGRVYKLNKDGSHGKTIAIARSKERAGKTYKTKINGKEVSVKYDKDGFPEFNSKYDTVIDDSLLNNGNRGNHFKDANKNIARNLKNDSSLAKQMNLTGEQVKYFEKGKNFDESPPGLTWHHHQDVGRMQLVEREIHKNPMFTHAGGHAIWGK